MKPHRLEPTPRSNAHQPVLFDLSRNEDCVSLERAFERGEIREVHDSIASQAAEVVETRNAGVRFDEETLARQAAALIGPTSHEYGTWAHFPWSGQLVHLLPEPVFEELRTSRNRNKITRAEQDALRRLRVGIVGLSVGQSTAVTLALEGIGGFFRLADFDTLALSNLNRLRAGVHEIGENKAVLTARRIVEINPYARVELFASGLSEENVEAFLGSDGPLDLVFEECDDLSMKVRVREEARRRGVPVLMETSDRGLLDVERFDREPGRPLFHGLVGDVDSRSLRGLSAYEKVPIVLAIVGDVSLRGAASLVDVDTTLRTWPQLASAVALGSAINADAARRIALGRFNDSGRFYVELDRLVADGPRSGSVTAGAHSPGEDPQPPRTVAVKGGPLRDDEVRKIVTWATLAPSGGNAQPWRFVYREHEGELQVRLDPRRATSSLDYAERGSLVALGAAVENARLCTKMLGKSADVELGPSDDRDLVATIRFSGPRRLEHDAAVIRAGVDDTLARYVDSRATRRSTGVEERLPGSLLAEFCSFVEAEGGRLDVVTDARQLGILAEIVATGDKLRLLNPLLHEELVAELRWSEEEAERKRDGLDIGTLELTPTDVAAMRLLRSPEVLRTLREIGGGEGLKRATRRAVAGAAAVGLLRRPGSRTPLAYLEGGRLMQRLWLWCEANEVGLHPMTGFLYWLESEAVLRNRIEYFAGAGAAFTAAEYETLVKLRADFLSQFPPVDGPEILFFRFVRARGSARRSLRRPIADVLSVG